MLCEATAAVRTAVFPYVCGGEQVLSCGCFAEAGCVMLQLGRVSCHRGKLRGYMSARDVVGRWEGNQARNN